MQNQMNNAQRPLRDSWNGDGTDVASSAGERNVDLALT
jgi:hypothetical protein